MLIRSKYVLSSKFVLPSLTICIYYLSFGVYLFSFMLSTTLFNFPSYLFTFMYIASGAFLVIYEFSYIISDDYRIENYAGFLGTILLFLLSWHIADLKIAVTFFIVFSSRKMDFKAIGKECIIITSVMLIVVILCSQLGIIKDYVYTGEERVRHYLGFRYCLYPSTYLFNITALLIYLKKQDIRYIDILILFALNYSMYIQTVSRLTFYSAVMLLFVSLFLKIKPFQKNKRYKFFLPMCFGFFVLLLFSYMICWNYDKHNHTLRILNSVLGGRLQYANVSLHRFGVGLLGSDVQWNGWGLSSTGKIEANSINYLYVDNFFINILQKYGIVFTLTILSLITVMLFYAYKRKDYYLIIIMMFIGIHGLIDDAILYIPYNTFWTTVSIYIFSKENPGLKKVTMDKLNEFLSLNNRKKET